MKKLLIVFLSVFLLSLLTAQEENWLSYNINCQVLIEDRAGFGREAAEWAEDAGGYYTTLSPEYVVMRFPWQKLSEFREWINVRSIEIYQLDQQSQDLREEILNLRSGIEARQEVLDRNIEYLDRSNFAGTLALEQEIRRLMSEIDYRQGLLRKRENDRRMVQAVVNISFLNNSLPERTYSSFDWINHVDFFSFVKGYQPDYLWKSVNMELPQGFALVDDGFLWQALSPEGVKLQARYLRNEPEMGIEFWQEVLELECQERGYLSLGEPRTIATDQGETLVFMDWGIPYGREDYHYFTAFSVRGKRILAIEAAGPILLMDPYLEVIEDKLAEDL